MLKLFVSYKHEKGKENQHLIEIIVKSLKSFGNDVWFDNERLNELGASQAIEIEKGIMNSDFVICFITNEYIKSKSCTLEFFYANNNDKKCIYILLEKIERKIANGVNMYLFGDAIRFDAFKHKKETLNDYANEIFSQIKNSLNQTSSSP